MIDIHAHILPGVDDGSPSLEDSLEMARLAVESGVEAIVVIPHCNLPDEPCIAAQQLRPRRSRPKRFRCGSTPAWRFSERSTLPRGSAAASSARWPPHAIR